MRRQFRTVWISDTHLGSRGCQAIELADFLERIRCDRLYLVGDIIDFWRIRSRPFWPTSHNEVIQRLLTLVSAGVDVVYVPGNHDEAARHYLGLEFGGIRIVNECIHQTADGRQLLITHGDRFDLVVKHSRLVSLVGSAAYDWLVFFNRQYNHLRERLGKPKSSFSQTLKLKVKSACKFISAFEETLIREADERGLSGVVCGHVHKPEVRLDRIEYYNCGDWIEHCSALIEDETGQMELVTFAELFSPASIGSAATAPRQRASSTGDRSAAVTVEPDVAGV